MQHFARTLRFITVLICITMMIVGAVSICRYYLRTNQTLELTEQLNKLYEESEHTIDHHDMNSPSAAPFVFQGYQYIGDEILPAIQELHNTNPDCIGWLRIPNVLKQPVVYRDNTYYLDHDFYGKVSDAGTAFLNAAHPFAETSQYLFIHGHSMHDGTMFGRLLQYRNADYFAENPYLYFTTLYREEVYKVFAVIETPADDLYSLLRLGSPTFSGNAEFISFIDNLRTHALQFSDDAIDPHAALLALSTCHDSQRVTVFLYRLEEPSAS